MNTVYIPNLIRREDIIKYLQGKLAFIDKLRRAGVDRTSPKKIAALYQEADIIAGFYGLVINNGTIMEATNVNNNITPK